MQKELLYRFTRRLYKELKSKDSNIVLRKIRGSKTETIEGLYDYSNDEITLDFRREIISTYIHEIVHKFYPDASETFVLNMEHKIMNNLSVRQIKNIIKRFAEAL